MHHNAKITNVVDGDTYDALVDLDFNLTIKIRIRIMGINCAEMDHKNQAGLDAKNYAIKRLLNKKVVIDFYKYDSFGRCLCDIFLNDKNFAETLVQEGFAVDYLKAGGSYTSFFE
jgi:micrococcal nuclease